MSDGPSEARRASDELQRLIDAADELVASLEAVKDAAFGIEYRYLLVINGRLNKLGLRIQEKSL